MKKYSRKLEYIYQEINNINPTEILQGSTNRFMYIFNKVDKIYNAEEINLKGSQPFWTFG